MIKHIKTITKTATATLTLRDMGIIICNSADAQTYTLPTAIAGLWYEFKNTGAGVVTISNGSTLATLSQGQYAKLINNGTTWYAVAVDGTPYTHPSTHSADIIVDGTTNKAYTATEQTKLAGIATGAEVNVQSDWTATEGDALILNKPTAATTSVDGFMSASDKTKLDSLSTEGGSDSFIGLTDVPAAFTDQAGKVLQVNTGETALEFVNPSTPTAGDFISIVDNVISVTKEIYSAEFTDVSTGAVTATAINSIEGNPSNAFTIGTEYWASSSSPAWIKAQFTYPKKIMKYLIRSRNAYVEQSFKTFTLQGSNDNTNWTTVDTVEESIGWTVSEAREFMVDNPDYYLYYRIYVTAVQSGGFVGIADIILYKGGDNIRLDDTIQGNAVLYPLTADDGKFIKYNNATHTFEYDTPASAFVELTDVPAAFTDQAGKVLQVNTGETALEFVAPFIPYTEGGYTVEGFEGDPVFERTGAWSLSNIQPKTGIYCLRSQQNVSGSAEEFTLNVPVDGTISFDLAASGNPSNSWDKVEAYIDNVLVTTVLAVSSDTLTWTHYSMGITAGIHTLKVVYIVSYGGYLYSAFIDNISIPVNRTYYQGIEDHTNIPSFADNGDKILKINAGGTALEYVDHIGETGAVHGVATSEVNGFMSAADKITLDGIDEELDNKADIDTTPILKTVSYTLALTDRKTYQNCASADPIVVTIPTNAAVAFPVGTTLIIGREGAGTVTITPDTDVTLHSAGEKYTVGNQYGIVTLFQIAADTWRLYGDIA